MAYSLCAVTCHVSRVSAGDGDVSYDAVRHPAVAPPGARNCSVEWPLANSPSTCRRRMCRKHKSRIDTWTSWPNENPFVAGVVPLIYMIGLTKRLCKTKRQQLLTKRVRNYCLLALLSTCSSTGRDMRRKRCVQRTLGYQVLLEPLFLYSWSFTPRQTL